MVLARMATIQREMAANARMNPTQSIERANRAKAILDNPMYHEAYEMCRLAIIDRIEKCPISDTASAEDLRKCLKLLRDVRANLMVALNHGKLDAFRIEEEAKKTANPFRGLFR
jgi:hypothetical protein